MERNSIEQQLQQLLAEYWRIKSMEEQRRDAISHADFIRLENKVDNLLTAVNGNGEPGLMTRVRLLETYLWRAIGAAGAAALVLTLLEVLVHVGGRK